MALLGIRYGLVGGSVGSQHLSLPDAYGSRCRILNYFYYYVCLCAAVLPTMTMAKLLKL